MRNIQSVFRLPNLGRSNFARKMRDIGVQRIVKMIHKGFLVLLHVPRLGFLQAESAAGAIQNLAQTIDDADGARRPAFHDDVAAERIRAVQTVDDLLQRDILLGSKIGNLFFNDVILHESSP